MCLFGPDVTKSKNTDLSKKISYLFNTALEPVGGKIVSRSCNSNFNVTEVDWTFNFI